MNTPVVNALNDYFIEREKLSQISGWIGESVSSTILTPTYLALRQLKIQLGAFLKEEKINWSIQVSMGQGRATPDHYIALLSGNQKVSNGIYYCLCFDREGTGCVCGIMKSLTTRQKVEVDTQIRASASEQNAKSATWELYPPNNVNVWMRNNAFYNPIEITMKKLQASPEEICKELKKHIIDSSPMVAELVSKRKNYI